jgi:nucleoside-diphosphate-sugar epimerase
MEATTPDRAAHAVLHQELGAGTESLEGRHAVVFGGAGFIGSHLVAALRAAGASVLVADLAEPRRPLPEDVASIRCDVRERIDLDPGGPDPLVFNLAAVHRTPGHPDHEYFETNVAGAENVSDFCDRNDVQSLFFTSSIAVYGPTEVAVTEESELHPTSAYGRSKAQAEDIHRAWLRRGEGRRLVIVRPAAVFGPGEGGNFTRLAGALRKGTFLYPGRRDTLKGCGYVEDLVSSLLFMWGRAAPDVVYNFGYPQPPTLEGICEAFVRVGNLHRPMGTIPSGPVMTAARVLNAAGLRTFDPQRVQKLFLSTNVVPARLVAEGFEYGTDLEGAIARWHAGTRGEFV